MKVAAVINHPQEAEGMVRWALLMARSLAAPSKSTVVDDAATAADASGGETVVGALTLILGTEVAEAIAREAVDGCCGESGVRTAVEFVRARAPLAAGQERAFVDEVVDLVEAGGFRVLVVGKNRFGDDLSHRAQAVSRTLYDSAPCDTLLLRLGDPPVRKCNAVLVPSAGGSHSRAALRLAHRMVIQSGGRMTPLYVERGMSDADGEAVGELVLARVLAEAGVSDGEESRIDCRVVTELSADAGIRAEAERGNYDLLIIGSPNSGGLKRKLFGTIPDRLLSGDDPMAVAAIRARRSAGHRLRERFERFLRLRVPQLHRDERVGLFERLQTHSRWNFDFMTLITLSTAIAALGLVLDSTAVVIGAMLVAPLMTPLLGAGLALVQGNLPLMRICVQAILFGFMAAILVGVAVGFVAPLTQLTSELAGRGGLRLEDMGVAFLSGVAASYCIARPGLSSALAGVAIAAALVPPIATVGISIALGEMGNARGAAQLFAANVVAIVLGAAINFYAAGIRPSGQIVWVRRTTVLLLICATALLVPLASVVVSKLSERFDAPRSVMAQLETDFGTVLEEAEGLAPVSVQVSVRERRGDRWRLVCELVAIRHPEPDSIRRLAELASDRLGERAEVDLQVRTMLSSSASSHDDDDEAAVGGDSGN